MHLADDIAGEQRIESQQQAEDQGRHGDAGDDARAPQIDKTRPAPLGLQQHEGDHQPGKRDAGEFAEVDGAGEKRGAVEAVMHLQRHQQEADGDGACLDHSHQQVVGALAEQPGG